MKISQEQLNQPTEIERAYVTLRTAMEALEQSFKISLDEVKELSEVWSALDQIEEYILAKEGLEEI